MINIIIDTNILRENPSRDSLSFKSVSKLGRRKDLTIFLPEIIEKEFQSSQRELKCQQIKHLETAISSALKQNLLKHRRTQFEEIKKELNDNRLSILKEAEAPFNNWVDLTNIQRVKISIEQTSKAWETYFNGEHPFDKSRESKKHIPDAFIAQAINQICDEVGKLTFICRDSKLRDVFKNNSNIDTFSSLDEFIKSDLIQSLLEKADLIEKNIKQLESEIIAYENLDKELQNYIESNIGDEIHDKIIANPSIPEDNHEATIESYYSPSEIDLDLHNMSYYGDGFFGLTFKVKMDVAISYCIYKSDYYCLENDEHIPASISDWNDHYYLAEDECEINIKGAIGFMIDLIKTEEENKSINHTVKDIKIDKIESIEFIKW